MVPQPEVGVEQLHQQRQHSQQKSPSPYWSSSSSQQQRAITPPEFTMPSSHGQNARHRQQQSYASGDGGPPCLAAEKCQHLRHPGLLYVLRHLHQRLPSYKMPKESVVGTVKIVPRKPPPPEEKRNTAKGSDNAKRTAVDCHAVDFATTDAAIVDTTAKA
ncbi:hypothetical protein niasHS_016905 [Heterodera schachtii]|uniref:Uncharacterized protein n=1 Tax=Heterodera schachtii TaxID=97005 RepID=A0ABD2HYG8_HETSC